MALRTSDQITLVTAACAGAVITQQVWWTTSSWYATGVCGLLALVNAAWTVDALRRNNRRDTVACPTVGCGVYVAMVGVTPDERARLTALAVDHARHGGESW